MNKNGPPFSKARMKALELGKTRYHGRPCRTCGGTLRYVANYSCVPCQKIKTALR